ncbi:MAG: PQQ-dependent sugar dehydrogenase, partial [Planctomycetota bacterium]
MSAMRSRAVTCASIFVFACALSSVALAQPYGIDSRPPMSAYLNMPQTPPVPSGDFEAVLAFPGLSFSNPVFMTLAPGTSQFYVCEREGRIYSFQNDPGTTTKTLVLDVSDKTQGWDDCGLLGMAFHPEFGQPSSPNRGFFYVMYQYKDNPIPGPNRPPAATEAFNRLARFNIPDGDFVADPASETVLIQQHDRHVWHNGGAMFFHPTDGFLYFTIGDEGAANDSYGVSQKIDDKLFGGVFRIDVDMRGGAISHPIRRQPQSYSGRPSYTQNYYVPNDNPWQDAGGGVLEEFWALGVRSPHRMTIDPTTGWIFLGDVGQGSWEEVNFIEKGGNYQWAYREGNHNGGQSPPGTILGTEKPPLYEYPHGSTFPFNGNCVIGGYIYRGIEHPDLYGKYLFGDNTRGRIWSMDLGTSPPTVEYLCNMPSGSNYTGLSSFGIDNDGEMYMCKMGHTGAGYIYKLGRTGASGAPIPTTLSQTGAFSDTANLVASSELVSYKVASPLWSDAAGKKRWLGVPDGTQIDFTPTGEWDFPAGTVFVKHFDLEVDEVLGTRRRLETRLIVRQPTGGVYGVTYKWRPDESDADLLTAGLDEDITITTATGTRVQTWHYPSMSECLTCHNASAGHVLGVKTRQLNCDLDYPSAVTDNQLRTLNHIGYFSPALNEGDIPTYDALVSLDETGSPLEHRARSYIDANCAHCHRPGQVQAFFDARFDTPLASQGLVEGTIGNDFGFDNAVVIKPQDKWRSIFYFRDASLEPSIKMPPLAKNVIDQQWIDTLGQWIDSLPGTPALAPPEISPSGGSHDNTVDVTLTHLDHPDAEIYYTIDGSDPNDPSAILYSGTFALTQSATLRARAYKTGFVESVVAQADFVVQSFRIPENPTEVSQGINFEQYLGSWSALPDFDSLTPAEVGVRSNFDIAPRLANDDFGFRFIGYLDVPVTDVYTFYTNSDDGSQFFVGTDLVVD